MAASCAKERKQLDRAVYVRPALTRPLITKHCSGEMWRVSPGHTPNELLSDFAPPPQSFSAKLTKNTVKTMPLQLLSADVCDDMLFLTLQDLSCSAAQAGSA